MHRYFKKRVAAIGAILSLLVVIGSSAILPTLAATAIPEDIQAQINARTQQLEQVNKELQVTQTQLNAIQGQKSTLQNQVQSLDSSIKQLNLNIRKDELTAANLSDEIFNLQGDLMGIESAISTKKKAVTSLLQEVQKNDTMPLVIMLLAGKTLAEGFSDAQSIGDLRIRLNEDIKSLNQLSEQHSNTLEDLSGKKNEVAVHKENLVNHKEIVQDQKSERAALLADTKNQESIYKQKVESLTAQQEALDNEIERIEAQLKAGVSAGSLPGQEEGLFSWPIESVRVTQHYGVKSSLYRGKPHNGLDLAAPIGTPILSAANGTVVAVDNNDKSATARYQYGRYVLVRHANNLTTLYAHLSRQVVSVGQIVKRGEIIGYSGKTGYATGPHLHFGVYYTPSVSLTSIPPAAGLVPVGVVLAPENYLPAN